MRRLTRSSCAKCTWKSAAPPCDNVRVPRFHGIGAYRRGARLPVLTLLRGTLGGLLLTPAAQADVSGVVVDATDDTPLSSTLVSIQAGGAEVRTDEAGAFILPGEARTDLVVVAAKKGFFNGSVRASDGDADLKIALEHVPEEQDPNYVFRQPSDCGACHLVQVTAWETSPMGLAGSNTWVADLYAGNGTPDGGEGFVYLEDSVHAEENPASECAACHQPEKWLSEPWTGLAPTDSELPSVAHGISCEVCHKIANVDETKPNFPGLHSEVVTMTLPADRRVAVQYGVLGDTNFFEEGGMRSSYQPQLRAVVCGLCHQDKNDHDGDGDFEDQGGIVSEPTYLEWLASPYADPSSEEHADCVDCHMQATGARAACDQLPALGRPLGDIRSHNIVGTTPEFLESAVTLELDARVEDEQLLVDVRIKNDKTGHHVPTGVTIRNMILLVEVTHEDGTPLAFIGDHIVHELGGVGDPSLGNFAGLPGKLYANINEDAEGNSPTFFTDAVAVRSDNRIAAGHTDESTYAFLSTQGGPVQIRARLIYRRSWKSLTETKRWTTDGHGMPLADAQGPHFGHLMEEATSEIEVPRAEECALTDTCEPTGTGGAESSGGAGSPGGEGGEPILPDDPSDPGAAKSAAQNETGCGCRVARGSRPELPLALLIVGLATSALRLRVRRAPTRAINLRTTWTPNSLNGQR